MCRSTDGEWIEMKRQEDLRERRKVGMGQDGRKGVEVKALEWDGGAETGTYYAACTL